MLGDHRVTEKVGVTEPSGTHNYQPIDHIRIFNIELELACLCGGNIYANILNYIPQHKPQFQTSFSSILRIRIWSIEQTKISDDIIIIFFRSVKGICGFSRETVIAVTTNIESIEYRRRESREIGYEEHPRAGTSDDVEEIISLFHRYLGNIFTVKEFKACWRKVVR